MNVEMDHFFPLKKKGEQAALTIFKFSANSLVFHFTFWL